jgi:pyridoxamine 5'-phosphate oxidase
VTDTSQDTSQADYDVARPDPFARFALLLSAARNIAPSQLPEPTAFMLATVGADGRPSIRAMLLKGLDDRGFVFYTNLESRKGRDLAVNPAAAMCFHWQPLERQVRVEGDVERVTDAEADSYFATRPRGSQLGAWASSQSAPMEAEGDLERRITDVARRYEGEEVPRPPHWSGFRLIPAVMEFWMNMPSRLHVRHQYRRAADGWQMDRLFP